MIHRSRVRVFTASLQHQTQNYHCQQQGLNVTSWEYKTALQPDGANTTLPNGYACSDKEAKSARRSQFVKHLKEGTQSELLKRNFGRNQSGKRQREAAHCKFIQWVHAAIRRTSTNHTHGRTPGCDSCIDIQLISIFRFFLSRNWLLMHHAEQHLWNDTERPGIFGTVDGRHRFDILLQDYASAIQLLIYLIFLLQRA